MINEDNQLVCPHCKEEYGTHLIGYAPYFEKDNRLCLMLTFACECGKQFQIDVHQHEGITTFDSNGGEIAL